MNAEQVHKLAFQLQLFGVHKSVERRSEHAVADNQHPLEFLRILLEDELLARKERRAKTLTTRAKFRSTAELEDWDQSFERGVSKARLKELAQFSFCERHENLLLLGKTGEGKTHLAVAIGRRVCREGLSVQFMPMNFLFEEAAAQRAAGNYRAFITRLTQTRVLVLDDFGLRNYTHDEAMVLTDLLEDRYRRGEVIVTSQVDPKGWRKLFDDAVAAEAIVDRLTNPAQTVILSGGSYRPKLSLGKNK